MLTEFVRSRTYKIADVLDKEKVVVPLVKSLTAALDKRQVEVSSTAGCQVHHRSERFDSFSVSSSGDVADEHGHRVTIAESPRRFDQE